IDLLELNCYCGVAAIWRIQGPLPLTQSNDIQACVRVPDSGRAGPGCAGDAKGHCLLNPARPDDGLPDARSVAHIQPLLRSSIGIDSAAERAGRSNAEPISLADAEI